MGIYEDQRAATQRAELEAQKRFVRRIVIGVTVPIALLLLWALAPFATVPAGHRGVITSFGAPSGEVYSEGIHFRLPIRDTMNLVQVATQRADIKGDAASKDLQSVHMEVALNWHIRPEAAVGVFRDLGNDPEGRIVLPAAQEAMKSVVARYTAEELISKRSDVSSAIITHLRDRMQRHGLVVDEFSITNFKFSKSFDEAIEAKTTAEQLKLKADRDLERIKVEAEQQVARAKAEAESLRAQKEQVTPELLRLREVENQREAIKKWNGQLPVYSGGGAVPFINVGK
ncbi:prohibitin family protein [Burkholderia phage CSP3]|nr:prohibitin family protein [Burkholderia phage CSP3]